MCANVLQAVHDSEKWNTNATVLAASNYYSAVL
jgi:hypothetical protein